jgi:hypothetical protein
VKPAILVEMQERPTREPPHLVVAGGELARPASIHACAPLHHAEPVRERRAREGPGVIDEVSAMAEVVHEPALFCSQTTQSEPLQ